MTAPRHPAPRRPASSKRRLSRRRAAVIAIMLAAAGVTAAVVLSEHGTFRAATGSHPPDSPGSSTAAGTARGGAAQFGDGSPTLIPAPGATGPGGSSPRIAGCAPNPHLCGYPDATNTGPAAATAFKRVPQDVTSGPGWHWDSSFGQIRADGAGAVLDGIETQGPISIMAPDVTVENCKLDEDTTHQTPSDHSSVGVVVVKGSVNATVRNCVIYGTGTGADRLEVGIRAEDNTNGFQAIANNIYNMTTGVQTDYGIVRDNYIHDFGFYDWGPPDGPDHLNGTTSNSYGRYLTIEHNTILNDHQQTDAISLFEDFGAQHDRTIENNLVAGGDYAIYGGQNAGGPTAYNIRITGNRFARLFFPQGGYFGPVGAWTGSGPGNVYQGNVWDDTNKVVPAP